MCRLVGPPLLMMIQPRASAAVRMSPSYLAYPITTLQLTRPENASAKKEQVRCHITLQGQARPMTYCLGKLHGSPLRRRHQTLRNPRSDALLRPERCG